MIVLKLLDWICNPFERDAPRKAQPNPATWAGGAGTYASRLELCHGIQLYSGEGGDDTRVLYKANFPYIMKCHPMRMSDAWKGVEVHGGWINGRQKWKWNRGKEKSKLKIIKSIHVWPRRLVLAWPFFPSTHGGCWVRHECAKTYFWDVLHSSGWVSAGEWVEWGGLM